MTREATKQDYETFKRILKDFIKKSNQNAERFRANGYTNKGVKYIHKQPENFTLANLNFSKQYIKNSWTGSEDSTYINVGWLNITCTFKNYGITGFKNKFAVNDKKGKKRDDAISNYIAKEMDKLNKKCKAYSIEKLGLNDNNSPNKNLIEFFNEFLEMNKQYENLKQISDICKQYEKYKASNPSNRNGIEDDEFVWEGKEKAITHLFLERNKKIVAKKKQEAKNKGCLHCEVCGFSFIEKFNVEFIECHHKTPISKTRGKTKTKLEDLALVCANCHRMLHKKRTDKNDYFQMEELKSLTNRCGKT